MIAEPRQDRFIRQRDLVPPEQLTSYHAFVIGVGAIGRQVALQLAALGVPALTLMDEDTVSIENLAVQGYTPQDLQQTKVTCTAQACLQIHPELIMEAIPARFTRRTNLSPTRDRMAVFACVDSMASRQILFQQCHSRASFFADGRMAGEVLRVITSNDPPVDTHYPETLFEDRSAYPAPCTGRSTLYAASIAAGLMLSRFAAHLRGQAVAKDSLLNLMADEWIVL